jgi:hypothetical protein
MSKQPVPIGQYFLLLRRRVVAAAHLSCINVKSSSVIVNLMSADALKTVASKTFNADY